MTTRVPILLVATMALTLLGVGCEDSDEGDASANVACRHFRNVAADVRDGQLTDEELREKLQEVESDARVSDEPGVPEAARAMVAASTAGDPEALLSAIGDMDSACETAGF